MGSGIERASALELLNQYVKNPNMIKHSLASEAVMAKLAEHFGEDREKWSIAGLLHDVDVEITNADLTVHGLEAVKILEKVGLDPEVIRTIKLHNEVAAGEKRSTRFEYALASGEQITGLITATTLVYPDKKLASVKPNSIVKRMKEKAFAASCNRDIIRECELAGMPLAEFAALCLAAMQSISGELGL
jgi:putative nucleotidyltransferase with HDIG domain